MAACGCADAGAGPRRSRRARVPGARPRRVRTRAPPVPGRPRPAGSGAAGGADRNPVRPGDGAESSGAVGRGHAIRAPPAISATAMTASTRTGGRWSAIISRPRAMATATRPRTRGSRVGVRHPQHRGRRPGGRAAEPEDEQARAEHDQHRRQRHPERDTGVGGPGEDHRDGRHRRPSTPRWTRPAAHPAHWSAAAPRPRSTRAARPRQPRPAARGADPQPRDTAEHVSRAPGTCRARDEHRRRRTVPYAVKLAAGALLSRPLRRPPPTPPGSVAAAPAPPALRDHGDPADPSCVPDPIDDLGRG